MNTYFTVTAKQIQQLQGCCYCTARKEVKRLRDVLGLDKAQPLRLRDVAAAWDAPAQELAQALYNFIPRYTSTAERVR